MCGSFNRDWGKKNSKPVQKHTGEKTSTETYDTHALLDDCSHTKLSKTAVGKFAQSVFNPFIHRECVFCFCVVDVRCEHSDCVRDWPLSSSAQPIFFLSFWHVRHSCVLCWRALCARCTRIALREWFRIRKRPSAVSNNTGKIWRKLWGMPTDLPLLLCVGVVCWRLYSFITRLNQF